jgi:ferredoxin-NADP reductase/ferredoxin
MLVQTRPEVEGATPPSTRQLVIRFTDGATREVAVPIGSTALAAAKDCGLTLVSQCEVGTCCTCVGSVVSGELRMPADQVYPLRPAEISSGQRLLCQSFVDSDAEVVMDYPSALLDTNPTVNLAVRIAKLTWLADSVAQLDVKLPKSVKFGFTAGQYCRIKIPGTDEWRSYSIASGEHERFKLSFLIRVLPVGTMSQFLSSQAQVGDLLELEGPMGSFALDPQSRPHLLIAGGTGLAPMLSMIDKLKLVRPTPEIDLVFGCVKDADLFHLDELTARQSFMPSLKVRIVIEEEPRDPQILKGNPVSVLSDTDIDEATIAYLCGPPAMIAAATERLADFGLAPSDIRAEKFLAS